MGILAWLIVGLFTGAMAKFIMPSEQGGGIFLTIALGIVGAIVGGFIGTHLLGFAEITGFDLRGVAFAFGGSLLLLLVYGVVIRNRGKPEEKSNLERDE